MNTPNNEGSPIDRVLNLDIPYNHNKNTERDKIINAIIDEEEIEISPTQEKINRFFSYNIDYLRNSIIDILTSIKRAEFSNIIEGLES